MPRFLFGDFDHRVTVGAFRPDPQTMAVQEVQHGLPLQAAWLYGFFRDTGRHTWLEAFADRISADGLDA